MKFFLIFVLLEFASSTFTQVLNHKPPISEKAATARWLVHSTLYGTLSTSSGRLHDQAWGQTKSFVDGTETNSTGNLYFYDSALDASIQDTVVNPLVSFSLSSASLGLCPVQLLDPESPLCARVTLSVTFVIVTDTEELQFAKDALFQRHPTMEKWPSEHDWNVYKIDLSDIWLIDVFGGATIVSLDDYYAVKI